MRNHGPYSESDGHPMRTGSSSPAVQEVSKESIDHAKAESP